jgi:hypothetical protein
MGRLGGGSMKKCPKCGSQEIYSHIVVYGFSWVNVNTLTVDDMPDEVDFDYENLEDADELHCFSCDYSWSKRGERNENEN